MVDISFEDKKLHIDAKQIMDKIMKKIGKYGMLYEYDGMVSNGIYNFDFLVEKDKIKEFEKTLKHILGIPKIDKIKFNYDV